MRTILAIDLGKAKSVFCWYEPADQSHEFRTVPSTPQAFHDALVRREVDRVVIEVCDMAGWVKDLCDTLSMPILVANVAVEGWRWKNVKNKTDKGDALKLGQHALAGDLKTVWLPDRSTRHWRSLILYRHKLVERRTAIKNAIHALLVSEGRAVMGSKAVWGASSLAELRKLSVPIDQCDKEQLWPGHLWMELENLEHLQKQIESLDQKLDALGSADARVVRLKTIPGVGPRLSELVVSVIADAGRFKNARQVGAYAGLVPRRYQSGQTDRAGRISKAGCSKLRKLLLEIAWGMLQFNARGKGVFVRISKGQRTRRKQAAVALARRVLVWCWAMLRDGKDWKDPHPKETTTEGTERKDPTRKKTGALPPTGTLPRTLTSRRKAERLRDIALPATVPGT